MVPEIITAAAVPVAADAVGQTGTFAAVTGAAKTFIVVHPIGVAVATGAVLGLGTYYLLGKLFGKKKSAQPVAAGA
jgi:membrane protein DedA with SNARE-associated domain